jgi:hypothetical protein
MVLPSTIVLASGVYDNGCTEAIVQREIIYVGERVYNITFVAVVVGVANFKCSGASHS